MKNKIKFRKFKTSSGKKVLSGKDKESNEELMKKLMGKNLLSLHTEKPGSPFSVIKERPEKVTEKDLKETAIFTAKFSQDWKKNKSDVVVNIFNCRNVYKNENMKTGTFSVKKKKKVEVRKKDLKKVEEKINNQIK